uniref:Uncharacterized protein n=1 Tax=Romanomermis culicivorax TaxID=13658 RepID=A0A915K2E2_ROMCU
MDTSGTDDPQQFLHLLHISIIFIMKPIYEDITLDKDDIPIKILEDITSDEDALVAYEAFEDITS